MLRTIATLSLLTILHAAVAAQPPRPRIGPFRVGAVDLLRTKPTKEQKAKLQPDPNDLEKYAAFLRQPRTGIVRLFPDVGCSDNLYIIRADPKCLETFVESSYFSFRENEYTIRLLADLRLRNDNLITDGVLSQGLIVNVGNVEPDRVDLAAKELEYLAGFTAKADVGDAQQQYLDLVRGVRAGRFRFAKAAKLVENETYVLRVVAYRGNYFRVYNGYRINVLEGDKRVDMTVAFRVVRKSPDGGVTIVWKELTRRDAPKLTAPKRNSAKG